MLTLTPDERHEFAREIVVTGRLWRGLLSERLKDMGMTPPRWSALYWLSNSPEGISQTALADRAAVEPATLVRTIDLLEEQGLVERRVCATDRRINLLHLTPSAHAVVEQIDGVADALRLEVLDGVSAAEIRAGLALLRRIRSRLEMADAATKQAQRASGARERRAQGSRAG